MTQDELDRLERKWTSRDPLWGDRMIDTDPESVERIAAETLALVAEVKRLRATLEKIAADEMGGDEWYVDTARKALGK